MICEFPDPYPDELLYSVCARYDGLMQYPNKLTALYDFFGENNSSGVVDLPNKISHLISALPPGHLYTEDDFILENTLYPFYAPFLPKGRSELVRNAMRENGPNHVLTHVGLTADRLPQPEWLRFCPSCVAEDRRSVKETYWHRVHQIAGVEVCPHHPVFLENSVARWRGKHKARQLYSAEHTVTDVPARPLDLTNPVQASMCCIARASAWLLKWRGDSPGTDVLRERYFNLLLRKGLAYYNGRIRTKELIDRFLDFYSWGFLNKLSCKIEKTYCNWLLRLLHTGKSAVAQNPIRHILLQVFLGCLAEDLWTNFNEYKPFGCGPWPCLNHASEHFGQLIITDCRVADNLVRGKTGRPLGTFTCECDFAYNRVGQDNSREDVYRLSSVQTYGQVWEAKLQELWGNTAIPLSEIASQLGVSKLTVTRHAIRLKLPMNTPGSRQAKGYRRYRKYRRTFQDALTHYRREWQAIRKAHPKASRNQLIKTANFLYLWLRKNDYDWLESHLPPIVKATRRIKRIDWKSEDEKLATAIRASAKRIKSLSGRPVRASLNAILKETGHRSWVERHLGHLPLTSRAIRLHAESLEAYLIRKIIWAEDCFQQEGLLPSQHQLVRRASVRNKTGRSPDVLNALNMSMGRLKASVS